MCVRCCCVPQYSTCLASCTGTPAASPAVSTSRSSVYLTCWGESKHETHSPVRSIVRFVIQSFLILKVLHVKTARKFNNAPPWVHSNTTTTCELDWMNSSLSIRQTDRNALLYSEVCELFHQSSMSASNNQPIKQVCGWCTFSGAHRKQTISNCHAPSVKKVANKHCFTSSSAFYPVCHGDSSMTLSEELWMVREE